MKKIINERTCSEKFNININCHSRESLPRRQADGNPAINRSRIKSGMTWRVKTVSISIILTVVLFFPNQTWAAGLFLTNGYTQVAPAGFRAAILFDGERETIIESTTFNLNPLVVWNFVWLIPVPSKPEVEIIADDFFNKIDYLTQKKFSKNSLWQKILYFDLAEENYLPLEPYSRPVNISEAIIFEPGDYNSFKNRIYEMGYLLPKSAEQDIKTYLADNWYLVVLNVNTVHLQMAASDSLSVFGAHTLPVKISFPTDNIIYPLKLASVQPDIDSEAIPLSYQYGTSAEKILGEPDGKVGRMLASPSANKFPSLPLDLANLKIDLFVFADNKTAIEGFSTGFADKVNNEKFNFRDSPGNSYFRLPRKSMFLTRIFSFLPQSLAGDLHIVNAPDRVRVNPQVSIGEKILRVLMILTLTIGGITVFIRQKAFRIGRLSGDRARRSNS